MLHNALPAPAFLDGRLNSAAAPALFWRRYALDAPAALGSRAQLNFIYLLGRQSGGELHVSYQSMSVPLCSVFAFALKCLLNFCVCADPRLGGCNALAVGVLYTRRLRL